MTDCEDLSDEEHCTLALIGNNYQVENAPLKNDGSGTGQKIEKSIVIGVVHKDVPQVGGRGLPIF